jgi:hypothetical protein
MDSHQDFCSYELSKALKACGFDEPCDHCYAKTSDSEYEFVQMTTSRDYNKQRDGEPSFLSPICSAVPLWQAQEWLRERAIEVDVTPIFSHGGRDGYDWDVYDDFSGYPAIRGALPFAETYEQALSAGITAALELIKKGE